MNSFRRGWNKLKYKWEQDPEYMIGMIVAGMVAGGMFMTGAAKYKDARTRAKSQRIWDREVTRRERALEHS